jgi:hypothetical protein
MRILLKEAGCQESLIRKLGIDPPVKAQYAEVEALVYRADERAGPVDFEIWYQPSGRFSAETPNKACPSLGAGHNSDLAAVLQYSITPILHHSAEPAGPFAPRPCLWTLHLDRMPAAICTMVRFLLLSTPSEL